MENIKELYYDLRNQNDNAETGEMIDFPEKFEADKELEMLVKCVTDNELMFKLSYAIGSVHSASEMQGFVYGFRYAVRLLMDCK